MDISWEKPQKNRAGEHGEDKNGTRSQRGANIDQENEEVELTNY